MTTRSIEAVKQQWDTARADDSKRGYFVSYKEVKDMIDTLKASGGRVSRAELKALASLIADDPVITGPAAKEARELFAAANKNKSLDAAAIECVKAEISMHAVKPFSLLDLPGHKVTREMPASVRKAASELTEPNGTVWERAQVRKAQLAGHTIFIVDYYPMVDESDYEKIRVFSMTGREIAGGAIDDPMAGFWWK